MVLIKIDTSVNVVLIKIPHSIPYLSSALATSSCVNIKLVYPWLPWQIFFVDFGFEH